MATRTPSLQARSQHGHYWGQYASTSALPNASGNPLATPYHSQLEAGDVAFVTGGTLYVCSSPGSVSGGDAVWSALAGGGEGGFPWVQGALSNGYVALPADARGDDQFTLLFLLRIEWPSSSGEQDIANNFDGIGGYRIWFDGTFNAMVATQGGDRFVQLAPHPTFFFPKKWMILGLSHLGGESSSLTELSMNGRVVAGSFDPSSGIYAAPAGSAPMFLADQGHTNNATGVRLAGVAYCASALGSNQLADVFDAAYRAGEIQQVSGLISRAWNAKSSAPGATWSPSIGAASDLIRIGAPLPSGTEDSPLWV